MDHTSEIRRPTLPALTGIRFVAAFAVLAVHFAKPANDYVKALNGHGIVGVTLFFILSGFILSYTYLLSTGIMKGTAKEFWAARFARIYPMYIFAFIITAPLILTWSRSGHVWWSGLATVTLTQAWIGVGVSEWNPPGWSLSAELFFYFAFPFLIKPVSRLRSQSIAGLSLVLWIASLVPTLVYIATGAEDRNFWMFNPLVRFPEFLLGLSAGVLWIRHERQVVNACKYLAEISFLVLLFIMCIPCNEAWVMNGALAPLFILIIFGLAAGRGPLSKILGTRLFVLVGSASFSLYIIHWPVWWMGKILVDRLHLDLQAGTVFFLIAVLVIVPVSIACFKLIEEPVNKRLRSKFSTGLSRNPVAEQSASGSVGDPDMLTIRD
jgi:peptidoglycan/LPS O-acetylase OafA/YrhL